MMVKVGPYPVGRNVLLPAMMMVPTEIVEVSVVELEGTGMIATTEIVEVRVVVATELDRLEDVTVVVEVRVEVGVLLVALMSGCGVGSVRVIVENAVVTTTGTAVVGLMFTPPGLHDGKPPSCSMNDCSAL